MKQIILISISIALFYICKTNAVESTCDDNSKDPRLQQVTGRFHESSCLTWANKPDRLLYADKYKSKICHKRSNCRNCCFNVPDLYTIYSIYTVKNYKDTLMVLADKKMYQMNLTKSRDEDFVTNYTVKLIKDIGGGSSLSNSVADNKGRVIVGLNNYNSAKVCIVKEDYALKTLIDNNKIIKDIAAAVLSTDYKYLFIGERNENLIYKFDYKINDGTVGDDYEVVFNKTEHKLEGSITAMQITHDNKIWISFSRIGMVMLYNWREQKFLQNIKLPTSYPGSLAFGGENLDTFYIGTVNLKNSKTDEEPGSGAIYSVTGTGTKGIPPIQLNMPKSE